MSLRSTSTARATALENLEALLRYRGYSPDDYLLEDLADDVLERSRSGRWTIRQDVDWPTVLPGYERAGLFPPQGAAAAAHPAGV